MKTSIVIEVKDHVADDLQKYMLGVHGVENCNIRYPSVASMVTLEIFLENTTPLTVAETVDLAVSSYLQGRNEAK